MKNVKLCTISAQNLPFVHKAESPLNFCKHDDNKSAFFKVSRRSTGDIMSVDDFQLHYFYHKDTESIPSQKILEDLINQISQQYSPDKNAMLRVVISQVNQGVSELKESKRRAETIKIEEQLLSNINAFYQKAQTQTQRDFISILHAMVQTQRGDEFPLHTKLRESSINIAEIFAEKQLKPQRVGFSDRAKSLISVFWPKAPSFAEQLEKLAIESLQHYNKKHNNQLSYGAPDNLAGKKRRIDHAENTPSDVRSTRSRSMSAI